MSAVWTLIDLLAGRRDPATLDAREWEAVISVARAEVLVATLAERLADANLPPAVSALFADLRAAMRVQQTQALWEAEMARRALEPIGVRFVLLKGTAYAAAGLPNAAGRQIGDLDILVAREGLDRAEAALLAAGWEWVKPDPYDDAYYRNHMHELPPLIHKDRDRMIDVHHTILPLTHRATPDAAAMLAGAITATSAAPCLTAVRVERSRDTVKESARPEGLSTSLEANGFERFLTLNPADMLIHCAAHVMADGDLAGGLRNMWDFHRLLPEMLDEAMDGNEPPDPVWVWDAARGALLCRAELHQLRPSVERAMRLAEHLFSDGSETLTRSDRLFLRALTARDDWGRPTRPFTRLAFTIRSHWMRMPPLMLARHLWVKWRRG